MKNRPPMSSPPGPRRVIQLDLDRPWPSLAPDDRYHGAMVIGLRRGVPCGSVNLDLDADAAQIGAHLTALATTVTDATTDRLADDRTNPHLPGISVVIPTIVNRVTDLDLLLDRLAATTYADVEVLLVDNRPTRPPNDPLHDPLPALVADHPGMRVIRAVQPGISAARNAGIEAARHDIVAFTDDDVQVDPGWLRAIGRRFADDPALDAVTGLILPAELETPAQIWFERYYGGFGGRRHFDRVDVRAETDTGRRRRCVASVRGGNGELIRRFSIYGVGAYGAGANMAFRRRSLHRHGLFDTALGTGTPARGGEDLAMLVAILWAGGKIGYEPGAVVSHRHRREWPQLLHQMRSNGVGFTAMLTAAVLGDRRHLLALSSQLPLAVRRITAQSLRRLTGMRPERLTTDDDSFPRQMVLDELRGYPRGPAAYLRSRRLDRSFRSSEPVRQRPGSDVVTAG